jgi:general secretion pathway protein D
VAIVEIKKDRIIDLGIEITSTNPAVANDKVAFGATTSKISTFKDMAAGLTKTPGAPEYGLVAGIWKNNSETIPILLQASEKNGDVDILAMPTLTTSNHTEAEISIEDQIPYDVVTLNTDGNPTSTTFGGYHKAGVVLKLTPHINDKGEIHLEINQEASEFLDSSENPPTSIRSAKTTITVPDGKTAVIGGLTKSRRITRTNGVPILCRIPVVGKVFGHENTENVKSNLCLFITPHILGEKTQVQDINERRNLEFERLRQHRKELNEENRMIEIKRKAEISVEKEGQ